MDGDQRIRIVECHAEGEVGDVVVGGVAPPPGETLWAQSRWIAEDDRLRRYLLNEPRGGVFRHCNLLVPPHHPDADAAFIIMEPMDTPPMSGSNSMCVTNVLLETGIAYGGDSFVVVNATSLGFALQPDEARDLAELGVRVSGAATEQIGFVHPTNPDWQHVSFCLFAAPLERSQTLTTRHAVAIRPGKIDRSPTGTGVSARLAILHARGEVVPGELLVARSIIDSAFVGRIEEATYVGNTPAVVPSIEGRAWITGTRELQLDPSDPWPNGYRVNDTWPGAGETDP